MSRARRAWFVAYPAAFAATYVLLAFTATPNPPSALWRPLVVSVVLAVALMVGLRLILGRSDRAALAASVLVLAALATWVPLLVVVGGGLWVAAMAWLARRRRHGVAWSEARVSRLAGTFAWALATVATVSALLPSVAFLPQAAAAPSTQTTEARSDVVLLLLDGYPRGDSLREQFDVDPQPFHDALARRGFVVAADSRSNYTSTWMTIASMVHGRYVEEIDGLEEDPSSQAEQYRRLMRGISEGEVLSDLRRAGYEIVSVPSPYESASITTADRVVPPPELTSFELSLLQHSFAGRVLLEAFPELAFEQHRDRVRSSLDIAVAEAAAARSRPVMVFAHLLAPHSPLAFVDDRPAPTCFPGCSLYVMGPEGDWSGYPEHLDAVNRLVLDAIDRVRAADPTTTIILMSDHGTVRLGRHDGPNAFRSFFAASVPDGGVSFPPDVTPIDVLRLVADPAVKRTEPYRAWASEPEAPMSVERVDGAAR